MLFLLFCYFFLLQCGSYFYWNDRYRVAQIFIITISLYLFLFEKRPWQAFKAVPSLRFLLTAILCCGAISSFHSTQPIWSFTEISLTIGCFGLFNALLSLAQEKKNVSWQHTLGNVTFFTSLFFLIQAAWVYVFDLERTNIDLHQLAASFDNPRFLGQIITLALPIMGAYLITPRIFHEHPIASNLKLLIFFSTWSLVIATGTRGTWLAICVVTLISCLTGAIARRWLLLQLFGVAAGLALTSLLVYVIPQSLKLTIYNPPGERLHLGLSAREIIWAQAWEMIQSAPWLGNGPMHFAQLHSVAGAHPHQLLLQFAAEWGLLATACMCALTGWALVAMLRRMVLWQKQRHAHAALYIGLSTAVAASLVQSMVDGVWVMPYTQTALTAVAALAFALHHEKALAAFRARPLNAWDKCYTVALLGAVVILLYSLYPGSSTSLHNALIRFEELPHGDFKPRFWIQGFI